MNRPATYLVWAAGGAFILGILSAVTAPSLFWALALGGAMTGAAIRVGLDILRAEDTD